MIRRMQSAVKRGIRRLNPEQIAARPRLAPAFIHADILFPAAERDTEFSIAPLHDPANSGFDELRELFGRDFSGLKNHGTVVVFIRPESGSDDLLFSDTVPAEIRISRTDTAIITVLAADVADLHQTAQTDVRPDMAQLHFVSGTEQRLLLLRVGQFQQMSEFRIRHQSTSPINPPPSRRSSS